MANKYWEDFKVNDKWETIRITITPAHLVIWAGLSGDFYPLHMDEEFAKKTIFGGRIVHGPLIFGMSIGLVAMTGIFEDSIIAWLGIENMRIPVPVKLGDTIGTEVAVKEKRSTKNPARGITIFTYTVKNQRGETVMLFDCMHLMHRRS